MLRFNVDTLKSYGLSGNYFNTSYVTVQPIVFLKFFRILGNFNTSYVTVQHLIMVQLLCLSLYFNTSYVTVQHICRKNDLCIQKYFNTSYVTVQHITRFFYSFCRFISIHLMLRFNFKYYLARIRFFLFQYILCYGSTFFILIQRLYPKNFNTSYVTVQHLKRKELLLYV